MILQSINFPFAPLPELNDEDRGGFTWGASVLRW